MWGGGSPWAPHWLSREKGKEPKVGRVERKLERGLREQSVGTWGREAEGRSGRVDSGRAWTIFLATSAPGVGGRVTRAHLPTEAGEAGACPVLATQC